MRFFDIRASFAQMARLARFVLPAQPGVDGYPALKAPMRRHPLFADKIGVRLPPSRDAVYFSRAYMNVTADDPIKVLFSRPAVAAVILAYVVAARSDVRRLARRLHAFARLAGRAARRARLGVRRRIVE